jgi:hypothetical protein
VRFWVKRLVYVAFSRDETLMGFGFPKEQRPVLVESEPHKFLLPPVADMRYNWVEVRVAVLDMDEMTELVTDAWTMVVPKHVAQEYFDALGTGRDVGKRSVNDRICRVEGGDASPDLPRGGR